MEYYCDRCSEKVEEGHQSVLTILQDHTTIWNTERKYKLCRQCTISLFIFLEGSV